MKNLLTIFLLIVSGCKPNPDKKETATGNDKNTVNSFYSKIVADTFQISISYPIDYNLQDKTKYPVVYLLDANLYFDIVASAFNKYSEVGITPAVILVGIGYKDFQTMDSLRSRDDTYPVAIPEYEMSVSGGADKFLEFINNELIPFIDKQHKSDTTNRILMGHSLGGYFTTYALQNNLSGKSNSFNAYIAASPSIHYNNYYLLNKFKETPSQQNRKRKIKAYITFGGLEDAEDAEDAEDSTMLKASEVSEQLSKSFAQKQVENLIYKTDIYSNLGHMDTPLPTFIKGLQWTLNDDNKNN